MASPTSRLNGNGSRAPDLADDVMLDEEKLRELSASYPTSQNSVDFKGLDGHWDFLSPSSSTSTTPSIGSPAPSYGGLTRNRSKAMKPRRNQSSYYDEGLGLWKCRNCGGTYDMPNPGSRQRREHKKACEDTQRLKALQRAQAEEQARKTQDARQNAFEEAGKLLERKTTQQQSANNVPDNSGKATRQQDVNNVPDNSGKAFSDDSGSVGAVSSTPDIPEVEEVNFGAPRELMYNVELEARKSDAARQSQQSLQANARAQSEIIEGEEPRPGKAGAELEDKERDVIEPSDQRVLPSETSPAENHAPEDTDSSPRKSEHFEESKPLNVSRQPSSNEALSNGNLDHEWFDQSSPTRRTKLLDELEHVKYCSSAASGETLHPASSTLYDELVDLHDDAQGSVARSASVGPGVMEAARVSRVSEEKDGTLSKNFSRAMSLDHYGVEIGTKKGYTKRISRLGVEADEAGHRKDSEDWLEVLVGKDQSRSPTWKEGVEFDSPQSRGLGKSIGDGSVGFTPTTSPSSDATRRRLSYTPRGVAASSSKQSQSDSPRVGASSKKPSDRREGDEDLVAVIARHVGHFWKHIAAVGAVAMVAWVGKSLADRQQPSRGRKVRRDHFAVHSYYWDDQ